MRIFKKLITLLIVMSIMLVLVPNFVNAAGTFSLSNSTANITTGKTTTINVITSNCEGKFTVSSSNTSVATVSTSSFWGDSSGTTITITAKSAGTTTITITPVDVTDTDLNDVTGAKTCKVTVTDPIKNPIVNNGSTGTSSSGNTSSSNNSSSSSNSSSSNNSSSSSNSSSSNNSTTTQHVKKSNNSKLSSLQIVEGVITPTFSNNIKEYSLNVSNEVTKISIAAIADHSKSTVSITGNNELQVGDNNIEITVKAEDGSKSVYKITVKRAQPELNLQSLTVAYIDEKGERVDLILNPMFSFNIYEYNIDNTLPHTVENIEVLGKANREDAIIKIVGNEGLKTGENEINIKTSVINETGLEEIKTYIIKVQKEDEPILIPLTTGQKIENLFNGIGSRISTWLSQNFNKILSGMLFVATITFVGLTFYLAYDYKNYQKVLAKLAELNKANLKERANIALTPELAKNEEVNNEEKIVETIPGEPTVKLGKGRRFK